MVPVRTVDLPLLHVAARHYFDRAALANMELDIVEHTVDSLVLQVTGWFASQQHEVTITHPATWWDAVKERFAPAWFRRRWPVVRTVHRVDAREVFPHYVLPKLGPSIRIALHDTQAFVDE